MRDARLLAFPWLSPGTLGTVTPRRADTRHTRPTVGRDVCLPSAPFCLRHHANPPPSPPAPSHSPRGCATSPAPSGFGSLRADRSGQASFWGSPFRVATLRPSKSRPPWLIVRGLMPPAPPSPPTISPTHSPCPPRTPRGGTRHAPSLRGKACPLPLPSVGGPLGGNLSPCGSVLFGQIG